MSIEVILTADDPKLGKRGEVVKVPPGFAQNFLVPHGKAVIATPAALKAVREEKENKLRAEAEALARAKELGEKLKALFLTIEAPTGEGDKLYGSVTSQSIQEALAKKGYKLDRKEIHLEEPIKRLGAYEVEVKLHPTVQVNLRISIMGKKA